MPERAPEAPAPPGLPTVLGTTLTISALVAFLGAWLNEQRHADWFYDNLDNEISVGSDVTLLLLVLGVILLLNGGALLLWPRWARAGR